MKSNKIVISIAGGNINGVFINNSDTKVFLVDYDNLQADSQSNCSNCLPTASIKEFLSHVKDEMVEFPCLGKLKSQLNE